MSTVNSPWKSVSPNICAWGKGFNHFSAVVRCEVVFVVVIIWFSGLECSPYAFVPLSTTYHPHSLWKGIASTRTPGQRPSILSHKPDGDMSIQKAPPPIPAIHFHWARFQFGHSGPICIYSNSSMRLPPWRHFSNYMHPHQGSDFPWIDIEYVLNTLELTANLALEIILGSTIRRIYSRDCQRSWECWMSSGWRLPCVSNDGWHTLYDPSTWDTASILVCPPCIVYALYVDRILRPGRLALTCARHIVPLQCLVGRVRWADGRVHTMPLSRPYTGRAPILSGETKPLWTRPSGHGGHAQMWGAVSFDQSSTPESRGPRYFQGVLDIGSKQRRWEWWYNSSMTVEKGDLNLNLKTNLECIRDTLGTSNLKLPICGNTDRLIL